MADFLSMGLGSVEASLDDRTAQALGMVTTTAFTQPMLVSTVNGPDKTMLYLTAAGVLLAALALFKKG